ncbi:MAG: hypothetical protein AAGH15_01065 [Myxococcota bacterium]
MGEDATLFLASVGLGWAALMTHGVALWQALLGPLSAGWKLAALLPPLTPVACWRGGKKVTAGVWAALFLAWGIVYAAL